jgi:hypothetical protein
MSIRHEVRHALPSIFDWTDNLPGFYTWPNGHVAQRGMRVEEFIEDGNYVVRAEMPGLDPEKDVTIEIDQGRLSIHAERREENREQGRFEFSLRRLFPADPNAAGRGREQAGSPLFGRNPHDNRATEQEAAGGPYDSHRIDNLSRKKRVRSRRSHPVLCVNAD